MGKGVSMDFIKCRLFIIEANVELDRCRYAPSFGFDLSDHVIPVLGHR